MSFGIYDVGATTFYACQADPRFSYCLYVPQQIHQQKNLPVCAVIHGSRRTVEGYRDRFADFAEREGCIILCPLFPVGIPDRDDTSGYKYLYEKGIRYDLILLAMLEEVAERFSARRDRFLMHGFSGGGQFAHRFLYLHPHRLQAVSVAAPGIVTLPSDERWWMGLSDSKEIFGIYPDFDTIKSIPIQIMVGEQDLDGSEINLTPASRYWRPDCNKAGRNRLERATVLASALRDQGCQVQLDVIPGIHHEGFPLIPDATDFLARWISHGEPRFEHSEGREPEKH
ncbi:MAG: hydrolase [Oceanospirillum sp.]|nr:hydrolase [Oceanospirillum sp.]